MQDVTIAIHGTQAAFEVTQAGHPVWHRSRSGVQLRSTLGLPFTCLPALLLQALLHVRVHVAVLLPGAYRHL